jgi:hypothetical protein
VRRPGPLQRQDFLFAWRHDRDDKKQERDYETMNTKDDWKRTATIHDERRRALWSEVFPGGVMPIQVPVTCKVNVPGHESVDAYMLDLDAISDEQREGVITIIAKTFNMATIYLTHLRGEL